jgi:sulfur carrier protein
MEITVNNQPLFLDAPCSVTQLLTAVLQISTGGIAIAVNETIIAKSEWPEYTVQPADKVILIKAIQGG